MSGSAEPSSGWSGVRARLPAIGAALAFRSACFAAMLALALWNESQRAPTLPDLVLAHVPYVPWVDRANYVAWLFVYLPVSLALLFREPGRWIRYMVSGGLVSLARGVCIVVTTLGPPDPAHAGPGIGERSFGAAFLELLSPIGVFAHGSARAYMTQDLFFSGHAATTFLLLLYVWHRPGLRVLALVGHVAMVAAVFLAHLHYSIDVLGAWAVTFAIFAAREWQPRAGSG